MTTLREELEKLADEPWPHGGPRYGRTELALAAANLALEAAARECERDHATFCGDTGGFAAGSRVTALTLAAAIRAMRVEPPSPTI